MANLKQTDPEMARYIREETVRQSSCLSLIPSENYASRAVREAVGSTLTNKYSEGQVNKRYYQGNAVIDKVENLAKTRALSVFGLSEREWGVNVQALSGSPANLAVYHGLLAPGDTIMSMFLPDGGHLSHGWQLPGKKVTLVSSIWNISFYHVDRASRLFDYDRLMAQAREVKPKLLISGGTAYPREIDHKKMGEIARAVGAIYMADIAHEAGLVAAGVNTSPFPHADVVTMTTHKTLRGPRGAMIFARRSPDDLIAKINTSVFPGIQGGPHNHTIAGIAVCLHEAMQKPYVKYQEQVIKNARVLASEFAMSGFDVVSGSTDKHLVLLDMRTVGVSAWIAAWALEYAGIIVNRNTVPYDTGTSFYPSGLRLGTPAVTTRGMKEPEMKRIAGLIRGIVRDVAEYRIPEDKDGRTVFMKSIHKKLQTLDIVKKTAVEVRGLTHAFPTP
jgi:glycine hydroxymethyltransferase